MRGKHQINMHAVLVKTAPFWLHQRDREPNIAKIANDHRQGNRGQWQCMGDTAGLCSLLATPHWPSTLPIHSQWRTNQRLHRHPQSQAIRVHSLGARASLARVRHTADRYLPQVVEEGAPRILMPARHEFDALARSYEAWHACQTDHEYEGSQHPWGWGTRNTQTHHSNDILLSRSHD